MVNHFGWLDDRAMGEFKERFKEIDWPETHDRKICETTSCHCLPLPQYRKCATT
jgi:hypothetical protein